MGRKGSFFRSERLSVLARFSAAALDSCLSLRSASAVRGMLSVLISRIRKRLDLRSRSLGSRRPLWGLAADLYSSFSSCFQKSASRFGQRGWERRAKAGSGLENQKFPQKDFQGTDSEIRRSDSQIFLKQLLKLERADAFRGGTFAPLLFLRACAGASRTRASFYNSRNAFGFGSAIPGLLQIQLREFGSPIRLLGSFC